MGYISFLKPSFYGYQMTKLTHKRWLKTFYYGTHFACSKNFKLKNQIFRFKVCTFLKYLDFQQEIITVTDNTFQNHIGHTFITPRCKIMKILKNYRFFLYGSKKWVFFPILRGIKKKKVNNEQFNKRVNIFLTYPWRFHFNFPSVKWIIQK